ncbi:Tgl5p [Paramicrosporidium saccamoebae]|uniref:Tgl5p n=1 Tax=Paramicrosporidium saccamoebae TaxID=1246581 RepID=A0A2H9TPB6_9FUNG|nr:Tgl5p [Paramicrosporidium saccamoebae]
MISVRLDHLRGFNAEDDIASTMFFIRAGIGLPVLHSFAGTKALIEEYVHEVVHGLNRIADSKDPSIDPISKREFFSELLQTFGRTVLILHGGASFGMCHLGVVKALHERNLMPRIICGSYVGALVASLICVQDASKLSEIFSGETIKFDAFYRNGAQGSFKRKLTRFLKHGRLFDIRVMEECARHNIGDVTFREAYQKSGLILNITVYAKRKHEVPVLLNYMTAPDLVIWTAACASLATPGIYEEVMLLSKKEDGTIYPWHPSAVKLESARMVQEMPVKRLTELFNANNFIVSQVPSYLTWRPLRSEQYRGSFLWTLSNLATTEVSHRFRQMKELGLVPQIILNILNFFKAPMVGDVQITPTIYCSDIQYLLSNPDPKFVRYCIQKGEVATWKRHSQIEMRCAIEFAIEDIMRRLGNN